MNVRRKGSYPIRDVCFNERPVFNVSQPFHHPQPILSYHEDFYHEDFEGGEIIRHKEQRNFN